MKCPMCEREFGFDQLIPVKLGDTEYRLCEFDFIKVKTFIDGSIVGCTINITWGSGKLCWSSWAAIRDHLRRFGIKEVLEFGTGLSSELFLNEGMSLISCDILPHHIAAFQRHLAYKQAVFIPYPDNDHLPDIEGMYPGRKWDFVFVDGPQKRAKEVALAMKLSSRFIYLHDPNAGEESFFPNEDWVMVPGDNKLFCKRGLL